MAKQLGTGAKVAIWIGVLAPDMLAMRKAGKVDKEGYLKV